MPKYASQFKASILKTSLSALMCLCASSSVFSQVQVVEAGADNSSSQTTTQSGVNNTGSNSGNEIIVTLYNMLEVLQREVQTLRGLVEEQSYQIRRMENEQRDRYLDVDNRLSELNQRMSLGVNGIGIGNTAPQVFGGGGIAEPSSLESAAQDALNPNLNNSTDSVTAVDVDPAFPLSTSSSQAAIALTEVANLEPKSEEELYQEARNLLLNDGEFESSISVFQQMIEDYPQGRLAPNAYYWQGEALILVERYSQAINVFNQVADNFPTHEKAPDSMLKLGIVYSLMDNDRRAQQVWRELLEDFADSGSASLRLAEVYLREGYNR
jgi:tol-pal system protein YbgF